MSRSTRRLVAYPIAAVVVAGLSWVGFWRPVDAEFMTLLSSASVHAQLAAAIPADSGNAKGEALRVKLIDDAVALLDRAERVEGGTSAACQLRAFIASVKGDDLASAALYRESRARADCTPEQLGRLVMHEARSLSNAGEERRALTLLDEHERDFRPEDRVDLEALRARLWFRAGDVDTAVAHANGMTDDGSEACLVAGDLLESMDHYDAAEAAYRKATLTPAVREYLLARLKARSGQSDTASDLLENSVESGDPEVRRLASRDAELWVEALGSSEFHRLMDPTGLPSAPSAGR